MKSGTSGTSKKEKRRIGRTRKTGRQNERNRYLNYRRRLVAALSKAGLWRNELWCLFISIFSAYALFTKQLYSAFDSPVFSSASLVLSALLSCPGFVSRGVSLYYFLIVYFTMVILFLLQPLLLLL